MDVFHPNFSPWSNPPDIGPVAWPPRSQTTDAALPPDRVAAPRFPPACKGRSSAALDVRAPDDVSALFAALINGLQSLLSRFGFGASPVATDMQRRPPPHFPAPGDPRYRVPE
ncbi:MAG: hypothetical protein ABR591_13420 [Candidatus Velthaea sp.]